MKDNTTGLFDEEVNAEEIKEILTEGSSLIEGEEEYLRDNEKVVNLDDDYEEFAGTEPDDFFYEENSFEESPFLEGEENQKDNRKALNEGININDKKESNDNSEDNEEINEELKKDIKEQEIEEKEHNKEIDKELEEILDRIKKRKQERKEKNRKRRNLFIIAGIIIGLFILSFTKLVNVDRVVVKGNNYFLDSEIISMAHVKMGNNLIYKPGKIRIKSYLLQNPYIEKVKVHRRLPSTLVIKVKEREQMAAIPYDGKYIVTDSDRIVLRKTTDMPHLTVIEGVKIKKMKLAKELEGENSKHLNDSYEILNLMKDHKLFFKKIIVDGDKTTIYIYDNLICTGMTSDIKTMIEKNRMQEILKTLIDKGVKRGRIVVSENGYATYIPTFN